jgi:hypothetical protein
MPDSSKNYQSAIKLLVLPAIAEAVLISGLLIFYLFENFSAKSLFLILAIFVFTFLIMFASGWSRRKIKSIEFSNGEMTILNAQDVINPELIVELKSISDIIKKRFGKKWDIVKKDGEKYCLNLHSFYPQDQEKIINEIKKGLTNR